VQGATRKNWVVEMKHTHQEKKKEEEEVEVEERRSFFL
jgi:hypothetical protein